MDEMSKLFTDSALHQLHIHQRLRRRVSRAIGAAIGRDMRVMVKDADTDRMRRARAVSPRARSRRERD